MTTYYTVDRNRVLQSGPHEAPSKFVYPSGSVITSEVPPVPGEGEAVMRIDGEWTTGPAPAPQDEPARPIWIHRVEYAVQLLTDAENAYWFDLIDEATQTPVADRTARQKMLLQAWRHFQLAEDIDINAPDTKAGAYLLWTEGVFGPVFDGTGTPTPEEQAALDRHARVAAGLPPE